MKWVRGLLLVLLDQLLYPSLEFEVELGIDFVLVVVVVVVGDIVMPGA